LKRLKRRSAGEGWLDRGEGQKKDTRSGDGRGGVGRLYVSRGREAKTSRACSPGWAEGFGPVCSLALLYSVSSVCLSAHSIPVCQGLDVWKGADTAGERSLLGRASWEGGPSILTTLDTLDSPHARMKLHGHAPRAPLMLWGKASRAGSPLRRSLASRRSQRHRQRRGGGPALACIRKAKGAGALVLTLALIS